MAVKKAGGSRGGRPPHKPTEKTRAIVERLCKDGASPGAIALAVGINVDTLAKHYDVERQGAHERTRETEAKVRQLMMAGWTQDTIATALNISVRALKMRYKDIVEDMMPALLAGVGGTLVQQARAGNVAACIFILKTRGGPEWHPPKEHRVAGDPNNETPIPVQTIRRVIVDPVGIDDDDGA